MMNRRWIVSAVIILILSACNFPSSQTTLTPLSPPTPDTPRSGSSTPTLIPIETLLALQEQTVTPNASQTPSLSIVSPKDQLVNCRSGPGTTYTVVGELKLGRQAELIGRNSDSSWWYVKNPSDPSTFCWLSASFTTTEGNLELLPVVNPPEITVTAIHVSIDPPAMNVACNGFPVFVTINAQITTSGPATVVWRWEESSTGDVSAEKILLFEEGGTKTVQDFYQVKGARDYTVVVRTTQPNGQTGQANFKATCIP